MVSNCIHLLQIHASPYKSWNNCSQTGMSLYADLEKQADISYVAQKQYLTVNP